MHGKGSCWNEDHPGNMEGRGREGGREREGGKEGAGGSDGGYRHNIHTVQGSGAAQRLHKQID